MNVTIHHPNNTRRPQWSTRLKFERGGCAADGFPFSVARTETTIPASNTTPRALHSTTLVTIQSVPCLAGLWRKHCAGVCHAQVNAVNWRSSLALRATDIDKGRVKESHRSPQQRDHHPSKHKDAEANHPSHPSRPAGAAASLHRTTTDCLTRCGLLPPDGQAKEPSMPSHARQQL